MTRIRFHIGAHKTATTHLQMILRRSTLAPGTRYVPLKRLRRLLISRVRKGRLVVPWHRWYRGTWLFSDENVLGTTANALKMYPDPGAALKFFSDCELSVFLCIRSYETFLPSAWGERLWHHDFRPFEPIIPQRRWTDVIDDLRSALPDVPIHVWCYEDYHDHAEGIARFYADGTIENFAPPLESRPKSGFSAKAVTHLNLYAGSHAGRRRLRQIWKRYPVSAQYPRFDPWNSAQKDVLRAMYAEDVETLQQQVEVWQP